MLVEDLVSDFRENVHDVATPYLWSDDEIYGYLDDAQNMFCREAVGISDSTSDLTICSFSAGDEYAVYDPRILRIRMARRQSDYYEVAVRNFEDFMAGQTGVTDYGAIVRPKLDMRTGPVHTIITNMEQNKLRLVFIPEVADAVLLSVYRLPLLPINTTDGNELEIDAYHHRYLYYWMKHLAYLKEDAETFNKGASAQNEGLFRQYCDKVKHEISVREHKVRSMAYGGI